MLFATAASAKDKKKDPGEIGDRDVGKGVNLYSLEREIAMGKKMAEDIVRAAKIVDDPLISEFVNRLAQNLSRNSDAKIPMTARVIDSSEVNAFALPGGFLFVNAGLIVKADTEAELASAVAHEIAHVAARHGTRQASRGQIVSWASLPLIFIGGWPGYAAYQGASLAVPLTFLKFSRGFEDEADMLGVQYLYKAGYDPTAFVTFLERMDALEKTRPGSISQLFKSHPKLTSRIESVQRHVQGFDSQPQYAVTSSAFNDVKLALAQNLNRRAAAPAGPTLRRQPKSPDGSDNTPDSDERPTLKRRE
jgi:predicted Zn-dependent protease